jgi:hypothetical protein
MSQNKPTMENKMKSEIKFYGLMIVAIIGLSLIMSILFGCDEPGEEHEPVADPECIMGCEDYVAEYTICFGAGPWSESKTTCESICTWHELGETWDCMADLECETWDSGQCWDL